MDVGDAAEREGGAEGVSELSPGFESRAETTDWMNLPCSAVERKISKSILWPLQGERETYRAHPAEQLRQRRGGRPRPGGGGAASSTSLKQFKRHEMVREMSWRRWARPRDLTGRYKIGNLQEEWSSDVFDSQTVPPKPPTCLSTYQSLSSACPHEPG